MSIPLTVNLQVACKADGLPDEDTVARWLQAALDDSEFTADRGCEIAVRIVGEEEGRQLNGQFRGHDKPTNVLSFPDDTPPGIRDAIEPRPLGDLVLCEPVVRREAAGQGKQLADHWAHLLVHGTLHLLGYDHQQDDEAEVMERLETAILTSRGRPDPYAGDETG